jgi:hypothetical protein
MTRPANDEMIAGFRDGYDLTAPEPSTNRSASYRHGFMCGRIDKHVISWSGTSIDLSKLADEAMETDDRQAGHAPFFECPGCGKDCADDSTSHQPSCPRS